MACVIAQLDMEDQIVQYLYVIHATSYCNMTSSFAISPLIAAMIEEAPGCSMGDVVEYIEASLIPFDNFDLTCENGVKEQICGAYFMECVPGRSQDQLLVSCIDGSEEVDDECPCNDQFNSDLCKRYVSDYLSFANDHFDVIQRDVNCSTSRSTIPPVPPIPPAINNFSIPLGTKYLFSISVGNSLTSMDFYEDLDQTVIYSFGDVEIVGKTPQPGNTSITKHDGYEVDAIDRSIVHVWFSFNSTSDLIPFPLKLKDGSFGGYVAYFVESLTFPVEMEEAPYYLVGAKISLLTDTTIYSQTSTSNKLFEDPIFSVSGVFPFDASGRGIIEIRVQLSVKNSRTANQTPTPPPPVTPPPPTPVPPPPVNPAEAFCAGKTITQPYQYYCDQSDSFFYCLQNDLVNSGMDVCDQGEICPCPMGDECPESTYGTPCIVPVSTTGNPQNQLDAIDFCSQQSYQSNIEYYCVDYENYYRCDELSPSSSSYESCPQATVCDCIPLNECPEYVNSSPCHFL